MGLDATLKDEPGEFAIWEQVKKLEAQYRQDPEAFERWAGTTADTLLQEAGLAADAFSRTRLITEMHKARMGRAGGDYSLDPTAQRFPDWTLSTALEVVPKGRPSGVETLASLFTIWETQHLKAGKPQKTVDDFRHKIDSLQTFLGHGM